MLSEVTGKGFEAWIETKDNKKRLNEYRVKHHPAQDGKSAYTECFLETVDEPFRIKISKLPSIKWKRDWKCRCLIDGHDEEDQYYTTELRFAPLPTTDDAAQVTLDPKAWNTLGSIELALSRGRLVDAGDGGPVVATLTQGTANEKAKKFPYTVKTGDRQALCSSLHSMCRFYEAFPGDIYYRFLFKYRAQAVLVKLHIIDEPVLQQAHQSSPSVLTAVEQEEGSLADKAVSQMDAGSSVFRATAVKREKKRPRLEGLIIDLSPDDEVYKAEKIAAAKRMKFLEDQNRALRSENKRLRAGNTSVDEPIDLTSDD
ncbi:hypothetical protein IAT40_000556 [Kwoniella sp. CBS 6097]